jgi:hypothetical protein
MSDGIGTVDVRYKIYSNRLIENGKRGDLRERSLLLNCNVYNGLINKISMRCRGGRTVQAAACRAAICGFNSHPRLLY